MSKQDPKDKSDRNAHYATLRRAHRDAKREAGQIPTPTGKERRKERAKGWKPPQLNDGQVFLYGLHTVDAALKNPERDLVRLSVTRNAIARLEIDSSG